MLYSLCSVLIIIFIYHLCIHLYPCLIIIYLYYCIEISVSSLPSQTDLAFGNCSRGPVLDRVVPENESIGVSPMMASFTMRVWSNWSSRFCRIRQFSKKKVPSILKWEEGENLYTSMLHAILSMNMLTPGGWLVSTENNCCNKAVKVVTLGRWNAKCMCGPVPRLRLYIKGGVRLARQPYLSFMGSCYIFDALALNDVFILSLALM